MQSASPNPAVVYELQSYLREIAFHHPEITPLNPDGIFGPETTRAVKDFQNLKGMKATGVVDFPTWRSIVNEYACVRHLDRQPISVHHFPHHDATLELGDEGPAIYILQAMIAQLCAAYTTLAHPNITGIFDAQTQKCIENIQRTLGLDVTGKVDRLTWNQIAALYNHTHPSERRAQQARSLRVRYRPISASEI